MPNWLDTAIAGAESFATVVVAWFGILQIKRERAQQTRLERAAVARISGIAYLLRRQLLGWVGRPEPPGLELANWITRSKEQPEGINPELNLATQRAMDMLALVGDAPDRVGRGVRQTYVTLLEGIRRLLVSVEPTWNSDDFERVAAARDDAEADFREVARILHDDVIDRQLLNEQATLARLREDDTSDSTVLTPDSASVEQEKSTQGRESSRVLGVTGIIEPVRAETSWWEFMKRWPSRGKVPERERLD